MRISYAQRMFIMVTAPLSHIHVRRGISTSMYKKTHLRTSAEMGFFAIRY